MKSSQKNNKNQSSVEMLQEELITGVILAGGKSTRMGRNKSLLDVGGISLIEKTYQIMASLFPDVVLITNTPEEYDFLNCRCQPDIYLGIGSIAGLHAALSTCDTDRIFVVPCDMPFLCPSLIKLLCKKGKIYDAVVPISQKGIEPLHALYHRRCLQQMEQAISEGDKKIQNFLQQISTCFLSVSDYQHIPDAEQSFQNLNLPADYAALNISQQENLSPILEKRHRKHSATL